MPHTAITDGSLPTAFVTEPSIAAPPTAAYVHIPFCRRRCFYCDFPIAVVGDKPPLRPTPGQSFGTIAHYIPILCQEIQQTLPTTGPPLQTVFLGGGTPSLLTVAQLETILTTLDRQVGLTATAEISMEIDPGTFDRTQLQGYRAAGVNRVSLGVQAFQSHLLAACGRTHTAMDIQQAVADIQAVGLDNYSLDLMSGLPHQTLADWQDSLARAIALAAPHLSCYDLTIEPMTAFGRQFRPGTAPLPSDDHTAQMYRLAQQRLTAAGYQHYEVSNYAKPGYACRHNRVYWEHRPFYGFGMGATSFVGGHRHSRPRKTHEYYAWVAEGCPRSEGSSGGSSGRASTGASGGEERAALTEDLLDRLMVGLRLAEGVAIAPLVQQYGGAMVERVGHRLAPYIEQGWVWVQAGDGQPVDWPLAPGWTTIPANSRFGLRDPEGFLFSNVVLVALFDEFGDEADSG
jgi:putative oxygen-independent coproporphyrinogen III oxidase